MRESLLQCLGVGQERDDLDGIRKIFYEGCWILVGMWVYMWWDFMIFIDKGYSRRIEGKSV